MSLELRDARRSTADREWLTNVYPLYLHDLSEFDDHYYTLDDRGVWMPDHRASWLEAGGDHPLILVDAGRRAGFALVNQAPSPHMQPGMDFRMSEIFELARNATAISFWRRVIGEYGAGRHEETTDELGVRQVIDTSR